MKIYLEEYFCDELNEKLIRQINLRVIDTDVLTEHIINCEFCSKSIKQIIKENLTPVKIFNLMKDAKF